MVRSPIVLASVLLAVLVSLAPMPAFAAPKEPPGGKTPRQRVTTPPDRPIAKPRQATSCAQFGAGFVRAPGSDTCVRIGGGIDVGVGTSQ
ncbi:hypothetical protein [Bradyrhizobium sp. SYSU BS000235]|uniref:hypothetical protein n=1 Tax=Bradyrhizobium sp. SYSU BS000235 TaxID=3411332 RepID=UPI003C73D384